MYQCQLVFYCAGHRRGMFQVMEQMPPLAHFTHTFIITEELETEKAAQADVIFADLWGMDALQTLTALVQARRENAEIILLADKEQMPVLDLSQVKDVWLTPLAEAELHFRFLRWQQSRRAKQDLLDDLFLKKQTLETVFTSADCGIMCHSIDGSRIFSINQAALDILGYASQEEMLANGFYLVADSVLAEDKPILRDAIRSLQNVGDSVNVEYRVRHTGGNILHIMGQVKLMDEMGTLYYQRFLLDCTAQKRRDDEERAQQNLEINYRQQLFDTFFNYLSNNTDDIYIILGRRDGHLNVEYITPSVQQALGFSTEEICQYMSASGQDKQPIGNMVEREKLEHIELGDILSGIEVEWVIPRTGVKKFFLKNVHCLDIQGTTKIIIYISDRTREHEIHDTLSMALDIAQSANRAKSAFLSSVSHDIRTPLNAITGFLTLLRQEANNPEYVREYTNRIDAASQQLLRLINDVLDMDKIESGSTTLNLAELSLAQIIGELNSIIRPQANARNQTFEILAAPFQYEHLIGDGLRINQVLINILSNAVKYTPEGGRITMSITEMPKVVEDHTRLRFVISDTGQGMSEEYLKVIFNPFTREQSAIANQIQGTGLGMAITKSLVDLMNGTIQVESTPGKGSTFTVELELRIHEPEADPGFWQDHGVNRVIVAAADEQVCGGIVRKMRDAGVTAHYVTHGADVIPMVRGAREQGEPYDLMLLDWMLPGLDGMEAVRMIRKNYSHKIPIVLLSAYDWSDIEKAAVEADIDHFLPKPFFMTNFKEAVQRVMGGRAKAAQAEPDDSVLKGKHLLVVDDIDVNRLILEKILHTLEATCDTAKNGREAVETFLASRPGEYDVILMDVQMPVMGGYEATKAIRECGHPSARTVPIIAMTANAFVDDVQDALAAGMDAHIAKPIVLDHMKATIQEVLTRK